MDNPARTFDVHDRSQIVTMLLNISESAGDNHPDRQMHIDRLKKVYGLTEEEAQFLIRGIRGWKRFWK